MHPFFTRCLRSALLVVSVGGPLTLLTLRPSHLVRAQAPPALPPVVEDGATWQEVYRDGRFFEGPVWDPATGKLYFTAFGQPRENTQILRLDGPGRVSVWMDRTGGINGMHLARDGRLLAAQAFGHNLYRMRIGPAGPEQVESLTREYEGRAYNQPNDVAESPATGDVYFTDPNFQARSGSAVYLLGRSGKVRRIVTHLKVPNGVEVSNDGKTLYVSDSFEKRVYSYPIQPDGTVRESEVRVFFDPPTPHQGDPDGMCSDAEGNLYFTMRGGIWVAAPDGRSLGLLPLPEFCSNVTFGGPEGRTLFATCAGKVYALRMRVRGPGPR